MKKILLILLILLFGFSAFCATTSKSDDDEDDEDSKTTSQSDTISLGITIASQYPEYPATPGDVYKISFLTAGSITPTEITGFVDSNYNIDLSFIGSINVKDLIYTQVQKSIKDQIIRSYPGSIVDVMLNAPGQFKVTLIGEVVEADRYDAMSLTTLSEILTDKTTEYASFRDIEIRSEDGTIHTYDLFSYKRFANPKNNPFLKPNDVITIKPYVKSVTITGQVKRPGTYQLLEGETLDTLINFYADGTTGVAELSNIEIRRSLDESSNYINETVYINGTDKEFSLVKLSNYDVVVIDNKNNYKPTVILQGAVAGGSATGTSVSNRIPVAIGTDTKLSTVISTMPAAFNLSSDLENSFILRGNEKIFVNLKEVKENPASLNNIRVFDKDIVVIPFRQLHVYVAGSINSGATKVPFIENRTAEYYIGAAGGFKLTESLFKNYTIRDVYGNKVKKDDIISPEDSIWVYKDHPMAYINEYGGWLISIAAIVVAADGIQTYVETLK